MRTVIIENWAVTFMPSAVFQGAIAGPGGDTIALQTSGNEPGTLSERESIALEGESGPLYSPTPTQYVTPSVLGLSNLPGRLYPRSRRG